MSEPRTSSEKLDEYTPAEPVPTAKFACVNRDVLFDLLDAILKEEDINWIRDTAKKIHFGLANGLGTAAALVSQAKEEERRAITAYLRRRAEWLRSEVAKGGTCGVEEQQALWMAEAIDRGRHEQP